MRQRYLNQIIYVKGRVLELWKQTGCALLFRSHSLSFCFSALFSYELKKGEIRDCTPDTVKTKTSTPLRSKTRRHTFIRTQKSCLHTLTISSLYGLERPHSSQRTQGSREKRLSQANAELIQLSETLQAKRSHATVVWEERNTCSRNDHQMISTKDPGNVRYKMCQMLSDYRYTL